MVNKIGDFARDDVHVVIVVTQRGRSMSSIIGRKEDHARPERDEVGAGDERCQCSR
jgi:hypothetical protein